jgi:hypothetical protein
MESGCSGYQPFVRFSARAIQLHALPDYDARSPSKLAFFFAMNGAMMPSGIAAISTNPNFTFAPRCARSFPANKD